MNKLSWASHDIMNVKALFTFPHLKWKQMYLLTQTCLHGLYICSSLRDLFTSLEPTRPPGLVWYLMEPYESSGKASFGTPSPAPNLYTGLLEIAWCSNSTQFWDLCLVSLLSGLWGPNIKWALNSSKSLTSNFWVLPWTWSSYGSSLYPYPQSWLRLRSLFISTILN